MYLMLLVVCSNGGWWGCSVPSIVSISWDQNESESLTGCGTAVVRVADHITSSAHFLFTGCTTGRYGH